MATYTSKLNLVKPELNDLVSPTVFADNFDKIDAAYAGLSSDLATTDSNLEKLNNSLDTKQNTITGAVSNLVTNNLTASRALVSNSSGKIAVSAVTSTELGYLDGVTSNVQTQLDNRMLTMVKTITSTNSYSYTMATGTNLY